MWDKTSEEFKDREDEKQDLASSILLLGATLLTIGQKGTNKSRQILQINFQYVLKYFTRTVNPDICGPIFTPFRKEIYA